MPRLAFVLVASLAACGGRGGQQAEQAAAPVAVAVTSVDAQARQLPVTLTLDGTLLADEDSNLTSVVAGRVVEVLVERGSIVTEGQPIVRLRDVDYRLQARSARASLEQARARLGMETGGNAPRAEDTPEARAAQADLDLAQQTLQRNEDLAQRGVISPQALDEARSRAASARDRVAQAVNGARASIASLESAQSALSQASTSASETLVRAPFAGEIAERMISIGEYVTPQTALVTLVRTDPLRLEVAVPQQHLLNVRPGQSVEIISDAMPGRAIEGTVRYVSASVRRDTRGLMVEAVVPNADRVLRPGMFVTARIATGGTQDVAVVPPNAILQQAGVDRVFVVANDVVDERVVTIARRGEGEVVIADGLRAGERVATSSLERLADGVHVTASSETAQAAPAAAPAP